MAYTFDNRVKYLVRFLYDIDNNGVLDKNDFDCMALRATIIETRGLYEEKLFQNNVKAMASLWNEFSTFADVNRDGKVTTEEFKAAIQKSIVGKNPKDFPRSLKAFITITFKSIDVNADGLIGLEEYRQDCVTRFVFNDIREIDDAYSKLVSEADKKAGGITLKRYEELFVQFISTTDDNANAVFLFGPLRVL